MAREIAASAAPLLPAVTPKGPRLPPWIERRLETLAHPDAEQRETFWRLFSGLSPQDRSIAAAAVADLRRSLDAPASVEQVRLWLAPILVATRGAPDAGAAMLFAGVLRDQGHPAVMYSVETQREAIATWKWWPAASEVGDLFKPRLDALRRQELALGRMVAESPDPAAPVAPLGAAERAAIVAEFRVKFDAAMAPARAAEAEERRALRERRIQPRPLSAEMLVASVLGDVRSGASSMEWAARFLQRPDLRPHVPAEWEASLWPQAVAS